MGRQHDEDKVEQKRSEVRMNRWYNRLLNRHQDDPVSDETNNHRVVCKLKSILLS